MLPYTATKRATVFKTALEGDAPVCEVLEDVNSRRAAPHMRPGEVCHKIGNLDRRLVGFRWGQQVGGLWFLSRRLANLRCYLLYRKPGGPQGRSGRL